MATMIWRAQLATIVLMVMLVGVQVKAAITCSSGTVATTNLNNCINQARNIPLNLALRFESLLYELG